MLWKTFSLALVLSAVVPCGAYAAFVPNYAAWKEAEITMQEVYVVGVIDGWIERSFIGEPAWMKAQRHGISNCMLAQDITAPMLVDLVNSHYDKNHVDWRIAPAVVLRQAITGICLPEVNDERQKVGLSPWKPVNGPIVSDD